MQHTLLTESPTQAQAEVVPTLHKRQKALTFECINPYLSPSAHWFGDRPPASNTITAPAIATTSLLPGPLKAQPEPSVALLDTYRGEDSAGGASTPFGSGVAAPTKVKIRTQSASLPVQVRIVLRTSRKCVTAARSLGVALPVHRGTGGRALAVGTRECRPRGLPGGAGSG